MESAKTKKEKNEEEIQDTQNKKYKDWKSPLTKLGKISASKSHSDKRKHFNSLTSSYRGAAKPKVKHERILFSLDKLKERTYIFDEIKNAKGDFVKISPEELENKIKDLVLSKQVTSVAHGIIFEARPPIVREELLQALDDITTHEVKIEDQYEKGKEGDEKGQSYFISVYTLDQSDLKDIDKIVKDKVEVFNSFEGDSYDIETTLLEVMVELFHDVYGEAPNYSIRKEPKLLDYLGAIAGMLRSKSKGSKGRGIQTSEGVVPEFTGEKVLPKEDITSLLSNIDRTMDRFVEQQVTIEDTIARLQDIDIAQQIKEYNKGLQEGIDSTTKKVEELSERGKELQKKLKSAKRQEKKFKDTKETDSDGNQTAYGKIKDVINQSQKALDIVAEEFDKGVEMLNRYEAQGVGDEKEFTDAMEGQVSEQISQLDKLQKRIRDYTLQLDIASPKEKGKTIAEVMEEVEPTKTEDIEESKKPIGSRSRTINPKGMEGSVFRQHIYALTEFQQVMQKLSEKLEVEMKEAEEYAKEHEQGIEIRLKGAAEQVTMEDDEQFSNLLSQLGMEEPSATEDDLDDIQKLVYRALQLKRKMKKINKRSRFS